MNPRPQPFVLAGLFALASAFEASAGAALVGRTEIWREEGPHIRNAAGVAWVGEPARLSVIDGDAAGAGPARLFELDLSGLEPARAQELAAFAEEASGLAHDPTKDAFFVSDDDALRLYRVDRRGRRLATLDLGRVGARDPEGVAYGPGIDRLFVADGRARRVLELDTSGGLVASVDLEPLGVQAAEGIAYDADSDHLLVVSDDAPAIFEITRDGTLVGSYDLLELGILRPRGLALAPVRRGSGPAAPRHVFVADAMNPDHRDGRIVEVALGHRPEGARVETTLLGDVDGFGFRGDEAGFPSGDLDHDGLLEPGERLPLSAGGAFPDRRELSDPPTTDLGFEVSESRPLVLEVVLDPSDEAPLWARVTLVVGGARALPGRRNLVRADGWLLGEVIPTRDDRIHAGMIGSSVLELPPAALRELTDGRLRIELTRAPGSGSDTVMVDYCRLEVAFAP
ncbi:MAG: SdiA-regulated domain-containing protein [Myxococcota bacterium]